MLVTSHPSSSRKLVVCFLEGRTVPASRYRVLQYIAHSKLEQVTYKALTTKPSKYLSCPSCWAAGPRIARHAFLVVSLVAVIVQRLIQILTYAKKADVIVLQRDLLFRVPFPWLEQLIFVLKGKEVPVYFDVDDAIFLDKQGDISPQQDRKLQTICTQCTAVIAGNTYLAEHFRPWAPVHIVPTVVDLSQYHPQRRAEDTVIGWTGLASNLRYMLALKSMLADLHRARGYRLRIVCEARTENPFLDTPIPVEMVGWDPASEARQLHGVRIGLVPLSDDPWSRGKCGLKLLQYMALGIPCVASPVGVISEIIQHGQNGFLARTDSEWREACLRLLNDRELWEAMSEKARATVESGYSLQGWIDRWEGIVCGGAG